MIKVKHPKEILNQSISEIMYEIRDFTDYDEVFTDGFQLENMEQGLTLLKKHLDLNSKIFLQVDSDADGLTSAALIYLYIKAIKPEVEIVYRMHLDKGHGLVDGTVPADTPLIILPDAGSNQYDLHKKYKELGYEILVLDHHQAEKMSEDACIINNQLSPNFENKDLSGVGVTYKFCECYSKTYLGSAPEKEFLDLVAVGMVADMMYVNNSENMTYMYQGLKNLKQPFFKEILNQNYFHSGDCTVTDVSFSIAPLCNAIFRMGTIEEKELMFLSLINPNERVENKKRGFSVDATAAAYEEAIRIGKNVRSRQMKAVEKVFEYLFIKFKHEPELLQNTITLVKLNNNNMPRELTGLLAMKLVAAHGKPAIVLMKNDHGAWSGSARSIPLKAAPSFKEFCSNSGFPIFAEGHDLAHGIAFTEENIQPFIEYCNEHLDPNDKIDTVYADFEVNVEDFTDGLVNKIDELAIVYGKGYEAISFYVPNLVVRSQNVDSMAQGSSAKFRVAGSDVEFVRFKDTETISVLLSSGSTVLDVVGTIQSKTLNGTTTKQFIVSHCEIKETKRFTF